MYDIDKTFLAQTPLEAIQLKQKYPNAVFVNGGTDVMIQMKNRKLKNAILIGIMNLDELKGIELMPDSAIRIGAGSRFVDIINNELLSSTIPALPYACRQIGSPQIRNIATIGGNICNGAVSADSVPVLLSYNAVLEIQDPEKISCISLCDYHTGPGKTNLADNEMLLAIKIAADDYKDYYSAFTKFGQRQAMEIATIACGTSLKLDKEKNRLVDLRISLSVAAPTPIRCYKTEQSLIGREINSQLFSDLRHLVVYDTNPRDSWRSSKDFRIQLIKELSVRTVREAIIKAGGNICD
ncbi:MAG: xanthine dehydrogenase FAD-binding subunit XdhB [Fastidiosipila sp.]|nr:xanthine dehydrogenase FAD-binding subunit XdhB [Fastidiosipila sp.]